MMTLRRHEEIGDSVGRLPLNGPPHFSLLILRCEKLD